MKKSKLTTKQIVLTGMMTAVLAVLSIVTIPLPTGVPVTLQTFAMAFCGYVLGWKLGGASSALYLILGAIGVPVYAGMSGGFGALLGPAGGTADLQFHILYFLLHFFLFQFTYRFKKLFHLI